MVSVFILWSAVYLVILHFAKSEDMNMAFMDFYTAIFWDMRKLTEIIGRNSK